MDEVLPFEHTFVIRLPVPTDSKNFTRTTLYGNYIRFSNLVVGVIETFNNKISVHFIYCIPLIISEGISTLFCFTNLYVGMIWFRVIEFYITVKLINL